MFKQSLTILIWAVGLSVGAVLVAADLISDSQAGGNRRHLISELLIFLIFIAGLIFLFQGWNKLRKRVATLTLKLDQANAEAKLWKENHGNLIQGLSKAIDDQLEKWRLTESEKEIARLLIKGLSHKEIAAIRNSTEKTVRTHGASIYQKSDLAGRAELAAFFLEDLLAPINSLNDN